MNPMVMLSLLTPGALAVFEPDEDPVDDPVVAPVDPPVVVPDELFDELLQAAVTTARAATMTAAPIPRRFIRVPPCVRWIPSLDRIRPALADQTAPGTILPGPGPVGLSGGRTDPQGRPGSQNRRRFPILEVW